jgi:TonB family protein
MRRCVTALVLVLLTIHPWAEEQDARADFEKIRAAIDIRSTGPFVILAHISAAQGSNKGQGQYRFVWISKDRWREDAVMGDDYVIQIRDGDKGYSKSSSSKAEYILEPYSHLGSYGLRPLTDKDRVTLRSKKVNGRQMSCFALQGARGESQSACLEENLPVQMGDDSRYSDFRDVLGKKVPFAWSASLNGIDYSAVVDRVEHLNDVPSKLFEVDDTFRRAALQCDAVAAAVKPATQISGLRPDYPQIAKAAHIQGEVVIRAVISETGNITDPKVVSGHPMLRDAALAVVKQWRYEPTSCDGIAVPVETTIHVNFYFQ